MKLDHEENRLSLRKKKITNIIASKRKISIINEIKEKDNQDYLQNKDEINIPKELRINIEEFNKNVIINTYNIFYSIYIV